MFGIDLQRRFKAKRRELRIAQSRGEILGIPRLITDQNPVSNSLFDCRNKLNVTGNAILEALQFAYDRSTHNYLRS
jgi:hypothetical protein